MLSSSHYDLLERAIVQSGRIVILRKGTELVVLPERLRIVTGREALDARHPSTGEQLTVFLDDLDGIESVSSR
jgi:hypothetical protein